MYFAGYKENNTLNKVLFICLLAFVFVLIVSSNCFANSSSDYSGCETVAFTFPDGSVGYVPSLSTLNNADVGKDYVIFLGSKPIIRSSSRIDEFYLFTFDNASYNSSSNTLHISPSSCYYSFYQKTDDPSNTFYKWSCANTASYANLNINSSKFDFSSLISSCDILNESGEIAFRKYTTFVNPSFITSKEELESGNFEALKISAGSLSNLGDSLILNIYNSTYIGDNIYSDIKYKSFMLDEKSSYWNAWDLVYTYVIPREKLGIDISNGKRYIFELVPIGEQKTYDKIAFTIGGLEAEDEIKNKQDEQTEAIKENTETNKGIWETIKDILSYINPFSENFFVYKLIELLVDSIKSLFIPSDDFFSTYFTDLKNWFSDRLGFLFYPFEIIIDILTKILNINFSDPIFNIPDLYEPFTNSKLISATTFNLNSMLENNIFSTLHNIYLICVDAFIVFELVNLFKRKYEEVTTK